MPEQTTEPQSRLLGTLNALPELIGACARKGGNIAFNIARYGDDYRFQIGVRKGDQFLVVGDPTSERVPPGRTLQNIADEELKVLGPKADVPDVFVDGKIYREAKQ